VGVGLENRNPDIFVQCTLNEDIIFYFISGFYSWFSLAYTYFSMVPWSFEHLRAASILSTNYGNRRLL